MAAPAHPKVSRHKTGKARLWLNGKDYYGPAFGTGKKPSPEAQAWADELIARWLANGRRLPDVSRPTVADAALAASNPKVTDTITVAEVAAAYLRHSQMRTRADGKPTKTHISDASALKYLKPWYRMPASEFGLPALIAYRDHFIKTAGRTVTPTVAESGQTLERKERLPPARGYVNDAVNRVRAAFRWAANRGLIEARVAHELSVLTSLTRGQAEGARETKRVPAVPDEHFYPTLDHMPQLPADILRILRVSVARPGELCELRPRELQTTDAGGRPLDVWIFEPTHHKTERLGEQRRIAIDSVAQAILTPYLEGCGPDDFVFTGARSAEMYRASRRASRRTPLTPSARARRARARPAAAATHYTTMALSHCLARAAKRAGVPHWHPHQTRHASAQETSDEHNLEATQAAGGWADPKSVQRYARPSTKKAEAAVVTLGEKHRSRILKPKAGG